MNAHHTISKKWYDDGSAEGASQPHEAPSGKGGRLIILHAGSKDEFVPDCNLVFVGKTKSHDYHDEMNAQHFTEWWTTKLLLNLLPSAVIVMDNAPYHSVKTDDSHAPTSSSRKADIQEWLRQRKIHFTEDMRKPELLELVRLNKPDVQFCPQIECSAPCEWCGLFCPGIAYFCLFPNRLCYFIVLSDLFYQQPVYAASHCCMSFSVGNLLCCRHRTPKLFLGQNEGFATLCCL